MKRSQIKRNPAQALEWQQRSQKTAREKKPKARTALAKNTPKRLKQESKYSRLCRAFKLANPFCKRCADMGLETPTRDVHHMMGKEGELLLDVSKFLPLCRLCHNWMDDNPMDAIVQGYSLSRHRSGYER